MKRFVAAVGDDRETTTHDAFVDADARARECVRCEK
jgi:hypothetical protein